MSLEDAKLFKNDIYALIVDILSAFNTTYHNRMFWIMYDLGLILPKTCMEMPPRRSDYPLWKHPGKTS